MLQQEKGVWRNEYRQDYVLFDLETTGISWHTDAIVEISAVKVRAGQIVDSFSQLVNPKRPIPWAASAVNHITDDMVRNEPDISVVLPEFLRFIGEDVLVGHNIGRFDMQFIWRDAAKLYGSVPGNDYIDTLRYAKVKLTGLPSYKLTTLAEYYGLSTVGAHRALKDCQMNQQVFELLNQEAPPAPVSVPSCPRCGLPLKKRRGRFGEFYGCTGYPVCRYTQNPL